MDILLSDLEIIWTCPDCMHEEIAGFEDALQGGTLCSKCATTRNKDVPMDYSDEAKVNK